MNPIELSAGLKGRYQITVRRADGSVRLETPWFDNLILTQGLNRIGSGGVASYCHVGSGNTAAALTDTGLQSFIAATGTKQAEVSGQQASAPYFGWCRRTYRFAAGVAMGNISEVGIGWSTSGATLFSRALVRDEVGAPMTITVLADEVLDVTYELQLYPPASDTAFQVTIAGVTYDFVGRTAQATSSWNQVGLFMDHGCTYAGGIATVNAYPGPIGTITAQPAGGQSAALSYVKAAYSNNSNQAAADITFGLNNGNVVDGIGAFYMYWYGLGAYQFSVSPKIPKNSAKVLTLKFTISWAAKTV